MQQTHQIAGLDAIINQGAEDSPTVVILHGYGADCNDLAPLAQVLQNPKDATWVFPNGPREVPIGPHVMGRAWFPIDVQQLEAAMMSGTHRDFSHLVPEHFLEAQEQVSRFIDALGVPPEKLVLGGFSQGAMLAGDIAFHQQENIKGLVLLSSTLVAKDRLEAVLPNHKGQRVFQSHGQGDPLLGFQAAEDLHNLLNQYELDTQFETFSGGHEIPPPVMQRLNEFLGSV